MNITHVNKKKSTGAVSSFAVKTANGILYRLRGFNESGGDLKILVFDSATAPSAGQQPDFVVTAYDGQHFDFTDFQRPVEFVNGIWIVTSTTGNTYTVTASTVTMLAHYV